MADATTLTEVGYVREIQKYKNGEFSYIHELNYIFSQILNYPCDKKLQYLKNHWTRIWFQDC